MNRKSELLSLEILGEGRYRIELDESWLHENPENKKGNRPWYELILCRRGNGIIYLFKPEFLILFAKNNVCQEVLDQVPGAEIHLPTSEGLLISFPEKHIHLVAAIAKARKRRRLSQERKEKLIEAGKAYQFLEKNHAAQGQNPAQI